MSVCIVAIGDDARENDRVLGRVADDVLAGRTEILVLDFGADAWSRDGAGRTRDWFVDNESLLRGRLRCFAFVTSSFLGRVATSIAFRVVAPVSSWVVAASVEEALRVMRQRGDMRRGS